MVFLKRCTTVLLAVALMFSAGTVVTPKSNAQEKVVKVVFSGNENHACTVRSLTAVGSLECASIQPAAQNSISPAIFEPFVSSTAQGPKLVEKPLESSPALSVTPSVEYTATPSGTLSADTLFSLVNEHRVQIGLPAFEHDGGVCAVASSRHDEIANEIFVTHALHSGFYAKNLPYWATENLIWQHTEADALNWWLHSPVHRAAIDGNYKYACGVCNGEVCNMVFTNYEQKVYASVQATPIPTVSSTPTAAIQPTVTPSTIIPSAVAQKAATSVK